jgi:hypothetical protein
LATVFSFGRGTGDKAEGIGGLKSDEFEEGGPTQFDFPGSDEGDQAGSEDRQGCIEVPVFGAGFILPPKGVADPMVADFRAAPMAADVLGKGGGRSWRSAAQIIGSGGVVGLTEARRGFVDYDQASDERQVDFQGFKSKDIDASVFKASVVAVAGLAGKRGVAVAATVCACWSALG